MSEEQERLLREGDGFLASQVSFDLEGPKKPVRRKSKKDADGKTSKKRVEDDHVFDVARLVPFELFEMRVCVCVCVCVCN